MHKVDTAIFKFKLYLASISYLSLLSDSTVPQFLREYKILVVGIGGGISGTPDLVSEFIQSDSIVDDEVEDSCRKSCMIDGQLVLLDVLDPSGAEVYAAVREQYLRVAEGFLLVYSIKSRSSFEEIRTFYQHIVEAKHQNPFPAVLVANHCHCESERQVGTQEGHDLAKALGYPFIETSCERRINVDEAFYVLVRKINDMDPRPPVGDLAISTPQVSPPSHSWNWLTRLLPSQSSLQAGGERTEISKSSKTSVSGTTKGFLASWRQKRVRK